MQQVCHFCACMIYEYAKFIAFAPPCFHICPFFHRNIKLISERSLALSKYFSQLSTLPQVVTSQPFQSFFEVKFRFSHCWFMRVSVFLYYIIQAVLYSLLIELLLVQMHSVESNAQRCFTLRSAGIEWRSRCRYPFFADTLFLQ